MRKTGKILPLFCVRSKRLERLEGMEEISLDVSRELKTPEQKATLKYSASLTE